MAVRFYGEFADDRGVEFRINLHDTAYGAAATELPLGPDGFTLQYRGNNEDRYKALLPSQLSWVFYNTEIAFDNFLNVTLPSAAEGRMLVEVLKAPGTASERLFWSGVLLPEQIEQLDEAMPSAVTLTAADDFAHLKNQPLDFLDSGTGFNLYSDIDDLLYDILSTCRNHTLYASTDSFLRYFNDFKASTYAGSNYLGDTSISIPSKFGNLSNDERRYDMHTVLESLGVTFNARIFQADGMYWFLPMNTYQQKIDGDTVGQDPILFGLKADGSIENISISDKLAFNSAMVAATDSTNLIKMSGGTITYQAPFKKVERTRTYFGNEVIISQYEDNEANFGSVLFNFSDGDITYFQDQTFVIQLNNSITIDADSSAETNPANLYSMRLDLNFKVGSYYWTNSGWTTTAGDYTIVIDSFQANVGTGGGQGQLFIETTGLPADQVGLDANVEHFVFTGFGTDVTSLVTCSYIFSTMSIKYGEVGAGPGDAVTYTAVTSLDNQVIYDQQEVVTGPIQINWSNGAFDNGESFISSQTATGYPIHRLGVREILANQQLPAQIRRGSMYLKNTGYMIWPYNMIQEGSDYYGIYELEYSANLREVNIERWRFNVNFTNITMPTETVSDNNPQADYGVVYNGLNRGINQVRNLVDGSQPIYQTVRLIQHTNATQYTIDVDDDNGFMYMNTWTGTVNGFGRIILPKVADNNGRMFRFKTDSTIGANTFYRVQLTASEIANGVTIDGASYAQMDRPYDGIAVLCYDGQWYVIQRKSK